MRKPQRHALRWFAFSSNVGERWTVILATAPFIAAIHEEGAPAAVGLTIFDLSIVVVDCGLSRAEQDETLLHELMHVASHDKRGLHRDTEERAITHISPSLHPLCVAIGGLSWPARPAGIAALEKLAQSFHTLGGQHGGRSLDARAAARSGGSARAHSAWAAQTQG